MESKNWNAMLGNRWVDVHESLTGPVCAERGALIKLAARELHSLLVGIDREVSAEGDDPAVCQALTWRAKDLSLAILGLADMSQDDVTEECRVLRCTPRPAV